MADPEKSDKGPVLKEKIELRSEVVEDLTVMINQIMLSYYEKTGITPTQAEMVHASHNLVYHWGKLQGKLDTQKKHEELIKSRRGMVVGSNVGG